MEFIRYHIKHSLTNITLFAQQFSNKPLLVVEVKFGMYKQYQNHSTQESKNTILQDYATAIIDFLEGRIFDLSKIKISLECYTDFQKKVLLSARAIPWGKTISYTQLAKMSKRPLAIRAVASVMRNNRYPLIIPCHRVRSKDNKIGRFSGQLHGPMVNLKKRLLEREGVKFNSSHLIIK